MPLSFPQAGELEGRVDSVKNENSFAGKEPVEHSDVTASASSAASSERSLKGGDISHTTCTPELAAKTIEENEAVAGTSTSDNSVSFGSGTTLATKFQESSLRSDKPEISITELLEYFFEPEILEGSNQYHCEQCHSLQDAERTVTISKASDFLVLTLKRFAYNVRTQQRSKILQGVSYPLILRLPKAHLKKSLSTRETKHSETHDLTTGVLEEKREDINETCFRSKRTKQEHKVLDDNADCDSVITSFEEKPSSDIVYSLCSVIVHSGTSSESGHYYCYARSSSHLLEEGERDDGAASSRTDDQHTWFLFNDSRVSYSAYSAFADVSKRFPKDTPYVLIYKRVGGVTVTPVESSSDESQYNLICKEIRPELADIVNRDNLLYLQVSQ